MTTANLATDFGQSRSSARRLRLPRDPLGLVSGFRGYLAFRDLSALSDADLAARGMTRADIPAKALAAITRDH